MLASEIGCQELEYTLIDNIVILPDVVLHPIIIIVVGWKHKYAGGVVTQISSGYFNGPYVRKLLELNGFLISNQGKARK